MSETALPSLAPPRARQGPSADWLRAAKRARVLSWLSLVWMGAEGAIAITAGLLAGSIALIGFGIDSAIEGVASLVIVWRFTGHRLLSHASEERAQMLVAIQFFILAPYVAYEALRQLIGGAHPEVSALGMVLTATSLVGMPFLGIAKQSDSRAPWAPPRHTAKGLRICSARTSRGRYSSAWPAMPCSGGGGSTRSRPCSWPASRSGRASRRGAVRAAAPLRT